MFIYNKLLSLDFEKRGKLSILGGFLMHTILGASYTWGNLNKYVTSFLVHQKKQDVKSNQLNIVFSLIVLFTAVGIVLSTILQKKIGQKKTLYIYSLVLPLSIMLSTALINFSYFVFFYGFLYGLSTGFLYMVPLENAQKYFPTRKGTAYGCITAGYGFGSLTFNWVLFELINPDDVEVQMYGDQLLYPPEISEKLQGTLITLAFIYLIIIMIASTLVIEPSDEELKRILGEQTENQQQKNGQEQQLNECLDTKMAFQQKQLYQLMIFAFFGTCFGFIIASNYKNYGLNFIKDDEYYYFLISFGSVANGFARFFWGFLMDKIPFNRIVTINLFIQVIIISTIQTSVQNQIFYAFSILLTFFCYGGWFSILPTQCYMIFGKTISQRIYGFIFFAFPTSGIIGMLMVWNLEWYFIFCCCFVVAILGLILIHFLKWEIDWNLLNVNLKPENLEKNEINSLQKNEKQIYVQMENEI